MNTHPKPDEWMSFLYGEESPSRQSELQAHLSACTDCRQQVEVWRGSMAALDSWQIPQPAQVRSSRRMVGWAAAAVVVLGIGFAFGRMSNSTTEELRAMQAGLREELNSSLNATRSEFAQALQLERAELLRAMDEVATEAASDETRQLLAQFAKAINDRRDADHAAYFAAFKAFEERRASDVASLRSDLDTVAVNADNGFSQTREQLIELATLAQPAGH